MVETNKTNDNQPPRQARQKSQKGENISFPERNE